MRTLITILALCFLVTTATAEEVKEVEKFKNMPVSTEAGGRFELFRLRVTMGLYSCWLSTPAEFGAITDF